MGLARLAAARMARGSNLAFDPHETCEEASFIRSASTHFTRQHDKVRSACQFWEG